MRPFGLLCPLVLSLVLAACDPAEPTSGAETAAENAADAAASRSPTLADTAPAEPDDFVYEAERFADLRILRYRVPGFESLDLETKKLLYYLYEAALESREIIYDQKHRYNLAIKRTLEEIVKHYPGNRDTDEFRALEVYLKRIWFSNGIHHHYSHDKFDPGFDFETFADFVRATPGDFPTRDGQSIDELLDELRPIMFDPSVDAKLVSRAAGVDPVAASAVNFYGPGITHAEVEAFYADKRDPHDPTPVSLGLNSRLVERGDGTLIEQVWRVGGLYSEALERTVRWLERAVEVAENDAQREALERLIEYYRSGDLEDWDEYNIAWVADDASDVDTINGFIEVYNDPIGMRGSYEAVVQIVDPAATQRIAAIAAEAQWFEENSPILDAHKKADVTGITGRVINVVVEAGDASPSTPVGINLPNSDWIRRRHGSKSISLANIVHAYDAVRGGAAEEFAHDAEELERYEAYGVLTSDLMTDMHEVIGHASGALEPGVGPLHETLGGYGSTIEEGRADLVALYFMTDPKMVELGLLPSVEAGYTMYDTYIRNSLLQQLYRIERGKDLEEDHMRNRQLIAAWAFELGREDGVIERIERDGKTYFDVRDYGALREIFGQQLRELQRIKSQGDREAAARLVETYGVKVDPTVHAEVLERYAALDIPPYSGFINPVLRPVERNGEIVDVEISYPTDFATQMLDYAERYSALPTWNF